MMEMKRLLVLLNASCFFLLDYKLNRLPLFILVAPPQQMARIMLTQM